MNWRLFRVAGLIGLALAVLITLLLVRKPFGHKTVVRAYFSDAMNLQSGSPVRLAGVEIGSVESVRARPELKEAPAEVVLVLTPSYELKIPNDSTASLETAGILGPTYVEIDVGHASGPPIGVDAVLKTTATPQLNAREALEKLQEMLHRKCDCDSGSKSDTAAMTRDKATSKNASKR
jgi:phospholipid/cholesterol/gamma-HCH transport system substrate-binding protein